MRAWCRQGKYGNDLQRLGDAHVWYDVVWSCAFVVRQTHGYVNWSIDQSSQTFEIWVVGLTAPIAGHQTNPVTLSRKWSAEKEDKAFEHPVNSLWTSRCS